MSFRLKDTDSVIHIRWIPRYTTLERVMHWVHTAAYIPLAITGFMLFASPWLLCFTDCQTARTIRVLHRVFAIFLGSTPIIYAILQPQRMVMHIRGFLTFCKYDIDWVKAAIPYYLLGRHGKMPPQPKFNTGERLNAIIMVTGVILFGISGLIMWFGKGIIPPGLYQAMLITHDLMFILTFAMFLVHFYLGMIHPLMWQSLTGMRFGYVSESYAREHHGRWYYGKERAMEMWEQHKAAEQEANSKAENEA